MKKNKITSAAHRHGPQGERTCISRSNGKYDANLRKRGLLHFQIGLILSLLFVYIGLELSFRAYQIPVDEVVGIQEVTWKVEEDLPFVLTEQHVTKKERRHASQTFKAVPDDVPLDPSPGLIYEAPDVPGNTDLDLAKIIFERPDTPEEIPFPVIEDAPIFPGCEAVERKLRLSCFQEMINKHIRNNFRYPQLEKDLEIEGKVYVSFRIMEDGSIDNIRLKGPSQGLEKEAERIIMKLPRMTPGKQRGRPVRVPFSIPIFFQLQ